MKVYLRRFALGAAIVSAVSLFVGTIPRASAADYAGYSALDQSQPVSFDGKTVKWNGKTFTLDDNTLFLDYRLDRAQLAGNPYAFNTLKDAVAKLKHGTAEKPMMLLTAPGVYWVDDPDDPAIRTASGGGGPYGMTITCNHLYFYGLNTKWQNVVFAANRGQTQGSAGNFTMFQIQGNGLKSENVTFGNYCNVDLKFPLVPSLGRPRRADAIAQAQLFSYSGKTYYNVPNVSNGVDPFGYAPAIKAAAVAAGKSENYYLSIPTAAALRVAGAPADPGAPATSAAPAAAAGPAGRGGRGGPAAPGARGGGGPGGPGGFAGGPTTIRSGQTTATLTCSVTPAMHAASFALGKWQFTANKPGMVQITPGANNSITVAGTNNTTEPADVIIVAKNELGLEACTRLTVEPGLIAPPTFARAPAITAPANGRVTLGYDLGLGAKGLTDESVIVWYRCTDAQGANPLKVAVSRRDRPEIAYVVSEGDVGSYLMATIQPKSSLSEAGPMQTVYSRSVVANDDVKVRAIETDFQNIPADSQPKIIPGTWSLDGYVPPETGSNNSPRFTANPNSWTYGQGQSGSLNYYGLDQTARGARLFYTPVGTKHGDMNVRARFAPDKNTGQGFGSATAQFLDVYIKYDLATRTGYGLRIQRLATEEIAAIGFDGGGAVAGCAVFLIKVADGVATPISKKVMTSAFVAECTVELAVKAGRLQGAVSSSDPIRSGDAFKYLREVQLDAPIETNSYGGTGILFTGTVGANSMLVTGWRTSWGE